MAAGTQRAGAFPERRQPDNRRLIDVLALTNMGLGDKAAAFGLLERAMATFPIEKDALDGAAVIETVAHVAARMGEPDRAISALRKAVSLPSPSRPPFTPRAAPPRSHVWCAAIRGFKNCAGISSHEPAQLLGEMCALFSACRNQKTLISRSVSQQKPNESHSHMPTSTLAQPLKVATKVGTRQLITKSSVVSARTNQDED